MSWALSSGGGGGGGGRREEGGVSVTSHCSPLIPQTTGGDYVRHTFVFTDPGVGFQLGLTFEF